MVGELNKVNAKKIHAVKQARKDLVENLIKRDKVVANALKSGVVVFGQELLVEVMKDVAR
jgi:transcription elongation GreA/GreB family factor